MRTEGIIAFPLQQWLPERATAYLVIIVVKSVLHCVGRFFLSFGAAPPPPPSGPWPTNSHAFYITRITVGRTSLDEGSARRRYLCLTTRNICVGLFSTKVNVPLGSINLAEFVEWLGAWWTLKKECIAQLRSRSQFLRPSRLTLNAVRTPDLSLSSMDMGDCFNLF
jgi:hypothetical protein